MTTAREVIGEVPMSDLHNAIMNLPCRTPASEHAYGAYERGHRDARHAAAELAAQHATDLAELASELEWYKQQHNQLHAEMKCPECGCRSITLTADTTWNCDGCKLRWSVNAVADLAELRKRVGELERLLQLAAKGLKPHGFGGSVLDKINEYLANPADLSSVAEGGGKNVPT